MHGHQRRVGEQYKLNIKRACSRKRPIRACELNPVSYPENPFDFNCELYSEDCQICELLR